MDQILTFAAVGFVAQMIDGTLGMAYGVSATAFLLSIGVSPTVASASVHAAKVVANAISGLSHYGFGNVDRFLVRRLLLPGVGGAVVGSYLLARIPGKTVMPFVSAYLLAMGLLILLKSFRPIAPNRVQTYLTPLGLVGGFLDAVGGGGWGPIVVSTLVARGNHPRFTIGSANFAEFFVALSVSGTFVLTIGLSYWQAILGLAIGGAIAAPIAAYLCRRVPLRALMILVGALIMALSLRVLFLVLR